MAFAKPVAPVLQRGHPLARGLVAAYPFYEGSGGALNDLSGNRNTGSLTNGPTWSGGQAGTSLLFNGSSQRVDIPNAPSLNPAFITIAAWVRSNAAGGFGFIVNKNYDGSSVAYSLSIGGAQSPFFDGMAYYDGAWNFSSVTTDIRGDNKWHFVVGSYDGVTLKYYLDAKLDASLSHSGSLPTTNTQPLYIGEYVNNAEFFGGYIDGLLIYNRALSASEIAQLYFDSFAMYRPRSRWWEVPAAAGAFTNRPGPRMGPAIPFGLAIGGAKLLERNPIMRRRELFRWGDRI
jgi:hypothetical protein